jgi:GH15 family glucan-1,4-alpha-glucosidase
MRREGSGRDGDQAAPRSPQAWVGGDSPFPRIGQYAFLSDCETTALVAPSGNVEWLCLPRMDSPSVFASILDRDAGGFRLGPTDIMVPAARRYLPGTMVLETSWATPTGWIIVRDLLLIGPWHHEHDHSITHRRAPTDYEADHILLRHVRCVNGEVQLTLDCEPVFDYGKDRGEWRWTEDGYHQAACKAPDGSVEVTLTSDLNIGFEGPRAVARAMMKEGETRFVALSWGNPPPPRSCAEAYPRLVWTAHHWQHWLARGHFPDHPWRSYLERSALTLRGLTYAPTGAIIAASTTSLPETPGGERNWDYRYSWIRDSTFALWGLYSLGFTWEANDFLYFVADAASGRPSLNDEIAEARRTEAKGSGSGPKGAAKATEKAAEAQKSRDEELQIMYGIGGERELPERTLDHLHGYEGARPVRVGNAAYRQRQHDMWGAVLDSVYLHTKSRDRLDDRIWPVLVHQVEDALAHWREPDRGIWEVRGEPKHFTSSKIMCWVAADRGARLARLREDFEYATRWQAAADEIKTDILANGVDERGVFTQHYDTRALDASLLLIPLVRFLPASDERVKRTVLAIADELTEHGLVLRYRTDETDDGLRGKEGSFTICSFWLVSALVEIGELSRARGLCERLLSAASPLGLYAEEIDPETGRHWGNYPQAFTHLALINAVIHIIDAEHRGASAAMPLSPRVAVSDAMDEMDSRLPIGPTLGESTPTPAPPVPAKPSEPGSDADPGGGDSPSR